MWKMGIFFKKLKSLLETTEAMFLNYSFSHGFGGESEHICPKLPKFFMPDKFKTFQIFSYQNAENVRHSNTDNLECSGRMFWVELKTEKYSLGYIEQKLDSNLNSSLAFGT